jgi:hypothetical protein
MPSTFTSRLKIERQASGENSGNWGNLTNYVFNRLDSSIRGYQAVSVAGSANVTLTSNNSTTNTDDSTTDDQVHNAVLEFTGALLGNIHVFTDNVESQYTVFNNTSGSFSLTFAPTGGTGVILQQGVRSLVYCNGTTMFNTFSDMLRTANIGVSVQAYNANLAAIGSLAVTDSNFIVGNGTAWVAESGATVRTSIGLGTASDVEFDSLGVGTPAGGTTGLIRATNDVVAFYSSDITFKENINIIPNPMDMVSKINGVYFDWKKDFLDSRGGEDNYFNRKKDVGVIAQEIEQVLPEIVGTRPDGTKAIKYDRLTCLLIECVKNLQNQINSLKKEA